MCDSLSVIMLIVSGVFVVFAIWTRKTPDGSEPIASHTDDMFKQRKPSFNVVCEDCKHFDGNDRCLRFASPHDPVTRKNLKCIDCRVYPWLCGMDGSAFELVPPKVVNDVSQP